MNIFRTELRIAPSDTFISHKTRVLTTGSCFADAIGSRLAHHKFQVSVNPFGVLYNPVSIHKALHYALENRLPHENTFTRSGELHANYDFHSELSSPDAGLLQQKITGTITRTNHYLRSTEWLFITYGTAWVYRRKDTGDIVANCHKMPASFFEKQLLSEDEIVGSFEALYQSLKQINPGTKIILTVSPVRHIKDTLELNSVSKAVLRLACYAIGQQFSDVMYFPAFEIMMDDLRDYRFYQADMLHPSEQAEDYIWEKFGERYFSTETRSFLQRWDSLRAALNHKPFHPGTTAHQQFLRETLKKLEELLGAVDVTDEIAHIKNQLIS
jgi:hypothetical protein